MPATLTCAPASWHDRAVARYEGTRGPTCSGLYWRLPGTVDRYVFWTMDDGTGRYVGIDPGDFAAELAGYVGVEVQLAAGANTAAAVATATRAALTGLYTVSGTGDDVTVAASGLGDSTVGGLFGASVAGSWGSRRLTPQFASTPLDGWVGQFMVSPAFDIIVEAIGLYLADTTTAVRVGLATGGDTDTWTAAVPRIEGVIPAGGAAGWQWWHAEPDEVYLLPASSDCRFLARSNGASIPGYIDIGVLLGTDFTDELEIYGGAGVAASTPFPADLSGESRTTTGVHILMAVQGRTADGTSVTWTTLVGARVPVVTDLVNQSSLLIPDAGGAELYMGAPLPEIEGLHYIAHGVAHGTDHSAQFRAFVAEGGEIGDAAGAVVLWEGRTSGSATNAWVETAIDPPVPCDLDEVAHWGVRNNAAGASVRFAFNADAEDADPIFIDAPATGGSHGPSDWVDLSEYEIFNSGGLYVTDPDLAVPSPVDPGTATVANNTNYPGARLRVGVPPPVAANETSTTVTGEGAATLLLPTASASGRRVELGSIACTLLLPLAEAAASRYETGAGAASLLLPTIAASGRGVIEADAAVALPLPVVSASARAPITASASAVLPLPVAAAAGRVPRIGTAACVLPLPRASASSTPAAPLSDLSLVTADAGGFSFYANRRPS